MSTQKRQRFSVAFQGAQGPKTRSFEAKGPADAFAATVGGKVRTVATWRARYRTPDGRELSRTFERKIDAENFIGDQKVAIRRGGWIDPAGGQKTFGEVAARWQANAQHRPGTAAQVETYFRLHVLPVLGDRPIWSIRPSDVQALVKQLEAKLGPATIGLIVTHMATVFSTAVDDGLITSSPTRKVKRPKVPKTRIVPATVEEVQAIAAHIGDRYAALVLFAATSGLRQGECFGLTVDRVDFLRRTVVVDRQAVLPGGVGVPTFGPPKTDASNRTVPLAVETINLLAHHLEVFPAGAEGLVFTGPDGLMLRRNRFNETWKTGRAVAGVRADLTFHDLRHFYASLLIRHGESVKVVQSRLGHASASETLDTYSHMWPDSDDRTREAVSLFFERGPNAAQEGSA